MDEQIAKLIGQPVSEADATHRGLVRNFCAAILKGEKRLAPGEECGMQVELADAFTLSSHLGQRVKLPISRSAYEALMARLIAKSKPKKTVKEQRVTDTQHAKELKRKPAKKK
jgi:hypothetical protein